MAKGNWKLLGYWGKLEKETFLTVFTFVKWNEEKGHSKVPLGVYRKERIKALQVLMGGTSDLVTDLITEDLISLVTQLIQEVLSFPEN